MKLRLSTLFLAILCLAPFAQGQTDDSNRYDRSTIFNGDSAEVVFLKHIWRRLGGPGDTPSGGSASSNAGGIAFANPATTSYRNTSVSSTAVNIKASAGMIYGCNYINPNTVPVYVKYFDNASATVGTSPVKDTILIPANGAYNIVRNGFPHGNFATAISLAVVTGYADNSTAAPTLPIIVQLSYQ